MRASGWKWGGGEIRKGVRMRGRSFRMVGVVMGVVRWVVGSQIKRTEKVISDEDSLRECYK